MKTKKVKIGDLKIDPKLTKIRHINKFFVSRYRQNYRAGAIFPMLIIQEGSNRVISGNTRLTAMLAEYPKDHIIEVEIRNYTNELEVLKDFTRENSTHGNPIDGITKKRLTIAMLEEGAELEDISRLFNVSVLRIEKLGNDIVIVEVGDGTVEERPKKKGFEPEHPITEAQYEEHSVDRGLTVVQQASQLIRWLSQDLVFHDKVNIQILKRLGDEIKCFLSNKGLKKVG